MEQKKVFSPEQIIASNPSENIWVQANAGTGKTKVLVHRLLRILFRNGKYDKNNVSGILCLTYTNAAAGEMRNRILQELHKWATSNDDELSELKRQNIRQVREELDSKELEFLNNCKLQIKRGNISFQHFLFNSNKEDLYPFEEIDIINTDKLVLDSNITFVGHEHNPFEMTVDSKRLIDVGSSGENTPYYTILYIDDDIKIEKIQLN